MQVLFPCNRGLSDDPIHKGLHQKEMDKKDGRQGLTAADREKIKAQHRRRGLKKKKQRQVGTAPSTGTSIPSVPATNGTEGNGTEG